MVKCSSLVGYGSCLLVFGLWFNRKELIFIVWILVILYSLYVSVCVGNWFVGICGSSLLVLMNVV